MKKKLVILSTLLAAGTTYLIADQYLDTPQLGESLTGQSAPETPHTAKVTVKTKKKKATTKKKAVNGDKKKTAKKKPKKLKETVKQYAIEKAVLNAAEKSAAAGDYEKAYRYLRDGLKGTKLATIEKYIG